MVNEQHEYRNVYFRPWVGKNYHSGGIFGTRVLALGESHYEWKPNALNENTTLDLIQEQANGEDPYPFWTKIAIAFLNRKPSKSDKYEFWHSVMFYNYIQCSVGNGPRIRPKREMWDKSENAFREILLVHQPRCIIVLGERLWNNLPDFGKQGPDVTVDGARRETYLYPTDKEKFALASPTKHPSSPGYSAWEWYPWVKASVELSKNPPAFFELDNPHES